MAAIDHSGIIIAFLGESFTLFILIGYTALAAKILEGFVGWHKANVNWIPIFTSDCQGEWRVFFFHQHWLTVGIEVIPYYMILALGQFKFLI